MPENRDVVLVIDDTAVRHAFKFVLEIAGLNVRLCESLAATLTIVAGGRCGCIVVDEGLPAIDAVRIVQELRKRGLTIPVIVLSSGLDRDLRDRTIRAGIHRILEFPVVDRSLLDAVLSACGKTTNNPPHT
jgi:FixJ family two-component response regulator